MPLLHFQPPHQRAAPLFVLLLVLVLLPSGTLAAEAAEGTGNLSAAERATVATNGTVNLSAEAHAAGTAIGNENLSAEVRASGAANGSENLAAEERTAGATNAGENRSIEDRATETTEGGEELSAEDLAELESEAAAALARGAPEAPTAHQQGVAGVLQSLNPDLAFIADVAAGWFSEGRPRTAGGHDPQKSGFTLQQLELTVSQSVDAYFRLDAALVFSQFGVEVEEVYATTLGLPGGVQARVGQFLTRFGRLNNSHPHGWEFVDQAFPLWRMFGAEANRGLGAELSWLTPLPWYAELVGSVTDAAGESTARSFYGAQDLGLRSPFDLQATLALKQFHALSDDLSLLWGLSGATGPNPTGHDNRTSLFGLDLFLKFRPISEASYASLTLQGEVFYRRRQIPGDLLQDWSGYVHSAWRFAQRWGVAARYEWGAPARLLDGRIAGDYLDPDWVHPRHRVSLAATFWPTEFSRIRAQGAVDQTDAHDEPNWSALLAFEFTVGAHGAHVF